MSDKLYEFDGLAEIEAIVYSEESEPRRILGPRVTGGRHPDPVFFTRCCAGENSAYKRKTNV